MYPEPTPVGLVPSESWTWACTRPEGPGGVVNVNESGVSDPVVGATVAPLKVKVLSTAKSEPLTVTSSPPDAGPAAGDSDEIAGPANVYLPMNVSQHGLAFA